MRKLLVLVACLAQSAAHAAAIGKPEVTVEIPDGWVEVPASVLQDFYDELKRQMPLEKVPKYDYAFQANAGPPWLAYPYVLVRVAPTGRPTERELEELPKVDLNEEMRKQGGDWSKILKGSSMGQMRFDKAANIVWLSSKNDVANVGTVSGISGMIPTEQGFIEMHGYALEADFAQHLPTFEKIISGAKAAPHLAYQPRWSDKLGPAAGLDFKRIGFFAVIGALIAVFAGIYRRRKN